MTCSSWGDVFRRVCWTKFALGPLERMGKAQVRMVDQRLSFLPAAERPVGEGM